MHNKPTLLPRYCRPGILAADKPLVVPMVLRISQLKLRGIIVLVVHKTKGVTLVFKNDPLESVDVSSTFDNIPMLRGYLQREIEKQLRNMLQDELPMMVHNLSLRYVQKEEQKRPTTAMSMYSSSCNSLPDLEYPSSPSVSSVDTPLSVDSYDCCWPENMKFNLTTPHPFSCHYSDTQSDILSSATTLVDIYADDADAPWYAKEALISPIYNNNDEASPVVFDDLILRPNENQMVSKLFKLASVHYTLSPLTEVIPHFTYRSLPYTIKSYSHAKTNKVPKRRIIKLSLSAPLI